MTLIFAFVTLIFATWGGEKWTLKNFDQVLGQDIFHRAGEGFKVASARSGQTLGKTDFHIFLFENSLVKLYKRGLVTKIKVKNWIIFLVHLGTKCDCKIL